MTQRQQRRYQQVQHGRDGGRRIAPHRTIAGAQIGQQVDRIHLRQRAARQHAAIIRDHFAQGAHQPGFAEQAARLAVGQQQSGRDDRAPSRDRAETVIRPRDIAVQPARRIHCRIQRAATQLAIRPGKQDRRMDQPGEQAMPGILDRPGRALSRFRIGAQPCSQNTLRRRGGLFARAAGRQIGQPGKTMHDAFERRRQARCGGTEIDLRDRRLHPVNQEMPGPQRRTGGTVAHRAGFRPWPAIAGARLCGTGRSTWNRECPCDRRNGSVSRPRPAMAARIPPEPARGPARAHPRGRRGLAARNRPAQRSRPLCTRTASWPAGSDWVNGIAIRSIAEGIGSGAASAFCIAGDTGCIVHQPSPFSAAMLAA